MSVNEPQKGVGYATLHGVKPELQAGRVPHSGILRPVHAVQGAPQAFAQNAKRRLQLCVSSVKEIYSIMSNECPLNFHALAWS